MRPPLPPRSIPLRPLPTLPQDLSIRFCLGGGCGPVADLEIVVSGAAGLCEIHEQGGVAVGGIGMGVALVDSSFRMVEDEALGQDPGRSFASVFRDEVGGGMPGGVG